MILDRLKLSNLAFTLKFVIAPGVAVALMCVLAFVGDAGLGRQVEQTRTIVERNLESAIHLSDIAVRVQAANGVLLGVMTRQAAGNGADMAVRITVLQGRHDGIVQDLVSYRRDHAGADQTAAIDNVIAQLKTYKDATTFVASMLEIDFTSVVSFMEPFEANFASLSQQIAAMVVAAATDSRQRAAQSAEEADRTSAIFLRLTGLATVLVALVAWAVARSTSRSITRIADATLRLARAETGVAIEELTRRDELGTIVDSLAVFRDTILKLGGLGFSHQPLILGAVQQVLHR